MNLTSGLETLGSETSGLLIAVLLVALTLMALWSSVSRPTPDRPATTFGPRVRGVFLAIRFRPLGSETESSHTGHMVALNLGTATFVSPRYMARGDAVELDLGTLPGYPASGSKVKTTVQSARSIGGEPASYMVTVRLPQLPEDDRRPLTSYIGKLAGSSRLSPA